MKDTSGKKDRHAIPIAVVWLQEDDSQPMMGLLQTFTIPFLGMTGTVELNGISLCQRLVNEGNILL